MSSKRTDQLLLQDILESAEKILRYTEGMSFAEFQSNDLVADAVTRNFGIIGEAAYSLSKLFCDTHTEIAWSEIVAFRHRVVHHYFGLDYEIIWELLDKELPILQRQIDSILDQLS